MREAPKSVRIYSPYLPSALTEGSFHVIADQARALKNLGFLVELVHWKDTEDQESFWSRSSRVLKSLFSDLASPEEFYYPESSDPASKLASVADYGIYHYSFSYNWLQKSHPRPEKKTFVHFHNLESELFRIRSQSEVTPSLVARSIHRMNASKLSDHELQLPKLADELWFLSSVDLEEFTSRLASKPSNATPQKFRLVPPSFDPVLFQKRSQVRPKNQSSDLVLGILGRYDFEPNRASLAWIIQELAPALKQAGFTGKIQVVGKAVPKSLMEQAEPFEFFEFLGFVPDLEETWSNLSFLLIPQFGGSGVRIKLLEALSSGVPVLANPEAVKPLSPALRASPMIFCYNSVSQWVDKILTEKPFETRRKFMDHGRLEELDGANIYRFLLM